MRPPLMGFALLSNCCTAITLDHNRSTLVIVFAIDAVVKVVVVAAAVVVADAVVVAAAVVVDCDCCPV